MRRENPATTEVHAFIVCATCTVETDVELSEGAEDGVFVEGADVISRFCGEAGGVGMGEE
jgi:hypothetical protein